MKYRLFAIAGILVMGVGGFGLAMTYVLPTQMNQAEYENILKTGLPSNAEKLSWFPWGTKGIENVRLFPNATAYSEKQIEAVRLGYIKNGIVTFGIYQAKVRDKDGQEVILPAFGPGAFTRVDWWPPLILAVTGLGIFFFGYWKLHAAAS